MKKNVKLESISAIKQVDINYLLNIKGGDRNVPETYKGGGGTWDYDNGTCKYDVWRDDISAIKAF